MPQSPSILRIHPDDDIIVALQDLPTGQTVTLDPTSYTLAEAIPAKHKFAAKTFSVGDPVHMYGVTIGKATQPIPIGARIRTSNIAHATGQTELRAADYRWTPPNVDRWRHATFQGYHRPDGSVGTANYWIVVPLVFCENRNLGIMRDAFLRQLGYDFASPYERFVNQLVQAQREGRDLEAIPDLADDAHLRAANPLFPHVDGVKFLAHTLGCAHSSSDAVTLAGLLAGYITHPNVAGATVLSLGCQKTQIDDLKAAIAERDPNFAKPIHYFEQQKEGSEKRMLSRAIRATFQGIAEANTLRRAPASLSQLKIGLECGGSDGFSGISSNPLLGAVSDRIAALGGSAILAEFPELCGIEQNLVNRCENLDTAKRFLELMKLYGAAAARAGSSFEHNPSPGNIADGLVTDAMKSAGAALKGGASPVVDVLDYPAKTTKPGLTLLCTPGNDVESTTALAGSGANLILFSTGLGTPTGNPIAPTIKVSSNSKIAREHRDLIDFDAGPLIDGTQTLDTLAESLLDLVIRTASGEATPHAVRLGQDDFIPWKRGVSL